VARTIADLAAHDRVGEDDVLLALSFRQRGGGERALAA
jgi:predicted ATPase with chaperone activity